MVRVDSKWERVLKNSQPMNLSFEIECNILSRLPVKSILRFKTVCRKWYALFQEPQFIEAHLNRSFQRSDRSYIVQKGDYSLVHCSPTSIFSLHNENFEKMCEFHFEKPGPSHICAVVGSIYGIICLRRTDFLNENNIFLWNPAIRELRLLPEIPVKPFGLASFGFGFDSKINDYKLLGMFDSKTTTEVRVFLSRTNRWRVFEVEKYYIFQHSAVHMNGSLHWLGNKENDLNILIISFDVSNEKIIEMDVPDYNSDDEVLLLESPQSQGKSLMVCICGYDKGSEIWFMKDYGDSRSWYKLYCFRPIPNLGHLVYNHCFFLANGKVVMECSESDKMVLYDPKNLRYKILKFNRGAVAVCKYHESLVSICNRL